jgi:DUF4097 and DUF4098 domain-containing protein YvlB
MEGPRRCAGVGAVSARSFVFEGVRQINVSNFGDGSIVVGQGPQDDAVEGTINTADPSLLDQVTVRQDHDQLRVDVPAKLLRGAPVHLRLGVPPGLYYNLSTGSAEVRIGVEAARTRVTSGSGDIVLDAVHDLTCSTGSGDVTVAELLGETAKVNSGSGDILVYRARCPVTAKAGSGDLVVRELRETRLQASSGSGDISVAWTTGAVDLRSASGSITVGVSQGLPAWLDLHSVSGDIRIALEASAEPARGEPYVTVRARTASGEIAVYRA